MADTTTPFLHLTKPVVGAEDGEDLWGDKLNTNWDLVDTNARAVSEDLDTIFAETLPEAPQDGIVYGRRDAQWYDMSAGITVSWGSITDKPADFPPSPHTHLIADVNGLGDALDDLDARIGINSTAIVNVSNAKYDKTGGTLTGDILINKDTPLVRLQKGVNTPAAVIGGRTGNIARWAMCLGDESPESGGNVGSAFYVSRFSDLGAEIDRPIRIARNTGVVNFTQPPTVNGGAMPVSPHTHPMTDVTGLATALDGKVDVGGDTMTGNLTLNVAQPVITLQKTASGQSSALLGALGGSMRWAMHLGDQIPETGAVDGSDFLLAGYSAGGTITNVIRAKRDGRIDFDQAPTVRGAPMSGVPEAPSDNSHFVRRNASWVDLATILFARQMAVGTGDTVSYRFLLQDPDDATQAILIQTGRFVNGGGNGNADFVVPFPTPFRTGTTPHVFVTPITATADYNVGMAGAHSMTATQFTVFRRYGGNPAGGVGVAGNAIFNRLDTGFVYIAIGRAP